MIFHISWWVFWNDSIANGWCRQLKVCTTSVIVKMTSVVLQITSNHAECFSKSSSSFNFTIHFVIAVGATQLHNEQTTKKKKRKPKIFDSLFFCSLTRQTYRPSHSSVRTLDRINRTAPVPQRRVRPSRPTIPASFVIALVQTSIT